ncbi:transcription termination factor 4, mitochondrial [Eudromia elegans]
MDLEARAGLLRRLGLERDALRRCPQLLALPRGRLEAAERLLRQRCLFTAAQLGALLRACPALLLREPHALHQHFQYAYFRMGLRHEAMARGRLFCAPFVELRRRHGFLERLGLYRAPRKGLERPRNPRLEELLHVPEATFVRRVARSTAHEYNVFKRLLAREEQEQQAEEDEDDDEDDDDNEDDDVLLLAWKGEALDSDGGGS